MAPSLGGGHTPIRATWRMTDGGHHGADGAYWNGLPELWLAPASPRCHGVPLVLLTATIGSDHIVGDMRVPLVPGGDELPPMVMVTGGRVGR